MTVHCTANRGRNGNRLITITEKTVSVSVEIILFRKNLKDEVKLQKKFGLISKIKFEYKFKYLTNRDYKKY